MAKREVSKRIELFQHVAISLCARVCGYICWQACVSIILAVLCSEGMLMSEKHLPPWLKKLQKYIGAPMTSICRLGSIFGVQSVDKSTEHASNVAVAALASRLSILCARAGAVW